MSSFARAFFIFLFLFLLFWKINFVEKFRSKSRLRSANLLRSPRAIYHDPVYRIYLSSLSPFFSKIVRWNFLSSRRIFKELRFIIFPTIFRARGIYLLGVYFDPSFCYQGSIHDKGNKVAVLCQRLLSLLHDKDVVWYRTSSTPPQSKLLSGVINHGNYQ